MRNENNDNIIYSINIDDIQEVANQVLERDLTDQEIALIQNSVGDYVDWFQAIENAINEHITEWVYSLKYKMTQDLLHQIDSLKSVLDTYRSSPAHVVKHQWTTPPFL